MYTSLFSSASAIARDKKSIFTLRKKVEHTKTSQLHKSVYRIPVKFSFQLTSSAGGNFSSLVFSFNFFFSFRLRAVEKNKKVFVRFFEARLFWEQRLGIRFSIQFLFFPKLETANFSTLNHSGIANFNRFSIV